MADLKKLKSFWESQAMTSKTMNVLGTLSYPKIFLQIPQSFINLHASSVGCCDAFSLYLINMLTSLFLSPEEKYLEVGVYGGRTLVAALMNNEVYADAIDRKFDGAQSLVKRFDFSDRVTFFSQTCESWWDENEPRQEYGMYFYDGDHDEESTLENLEKAIPFLADRSIVLVDDLAMSGTLKAVERWHRMHIDNIMFYWQVPTFMGKALIGYQK